MNAPSIAGFENDDREPLLRWIAAGLVVLGGHFAVAGAMFLFYRASYPVAGGVPVVLFELSPAARLPETPPVIAKPYEVEKMQEIPSRAPDAVPLTPERKLQKREEATPEIVAPPSYDAPAKSATAPAVGSLNVQPDPAETAWRNLLMAHLQKFKRYPRSAIARHTQGVVLLSFTVDREGRLIARSIVQGSGSEELDREALDMLLRAQPLPPFPASMQPEAQSFTVPVRFYLP